MKLIIGLGNPGKDYENTRHNIGFMILDSFVDGFTVEKKFQAMIKKSSFYDEDVLFVKPLTFMNLSGNAVKTIVDYYHISIADILVIQDDLDLILGKVRLKNNSSSGGHNGIKSIIHSLRTNEFCRMKVGILHEKKEDTIDYVLKKFSKKEMNYINANYETYQEIIMFWIKYGLDMTMQKYNNFGGYNE